MPTGLYATTVQISTLWHLSQCITWNPTIITIWKDTCLTGTSLPHHIVEITYKNSHYSKPILFGGGGWYWYIFHWGSLENERQAPGFFCIYTNIIDIKIFYQSKQWFASKPPSNIMCQRGFWLFSNHFKMPNYMHNIHYKIILHNLIS